MVKKNNVKKIVIASALAVVAVGGGMAVGALAFPKHISVPSAPQVIDASQEQLDKAFSDGVASVIIPEVEPVIEYKDVLVDNGNLELVLNHIYDNNGNIEYITEDLDDDEVDMIVDRVLLVNDFKKLAVDAIQKDLFDELDGSEFESVKFDDKDLEKLKINDEADEVIIEDIDFEDKDAEVKVSGSFRQDEEKFKFEAIVSIKDNEYDELSSIVITKE